MWLPDAAVLFPRKRRRVAEPISPDTSPYLHILMHRNGRRLRVLTEPDPDKALQACRAFAVSMDEEEVEGDGEGNGDGVGGGNGGKRPPRRLALVDRIERGKPLLLFVAGDRSKVGKSRCVRCIYMGACLLYTQCIYSDVPETLCLPTHT